MTLFAAGCGSSTNDGSGSGDNAAPQTLKTVVGSPGVAHGLYYVAKQKGLFEKNGLTVEQVSGGVSNAAALLVSGKADMLVGGTLFAVPLATQGKDVSVVFNNSDYGLTFASLVGQKGLTLKELRAKGSDCRIAVTGAGTILYGWLLDVSKAYGLECENATQDSLQGLTAAVASGAADAAVVLPEQAAALSKAGNAGMLIDPLAMTAKQRAAAVPGTAYPSGAMLGMKKNLSAKSEAVTRYVRALKEASAVVHSSTPQELAEIVKKDPDFAQNPVESLAIGWTDLKARTPYGANAGRITEEGWRTSLTSMQHWGLSDFSPDDPKLAYSAAVDMSYLDAS
ncbi:ABC transporter substrate-binding protein [Streptomyces sp. NBC_01352]|uniref:ABC transporter substrate-binding protein n=1 Tax=Streptomyces sp. NBC_01352 TaxID=2903834 RepID=UPI002E37839F|nr:ABC transporter substrate-binding protein [Streptomyces sp. NBC_01352]